MYLILTFYNPLASILYDPGVSNRYNSDFLNFFNPAASNCYKILSKFWKSENVHNSNLLQPSFFQSFTTQLSLIFYNPLASNLYDLCVSNLYNPDVSKHFQPGFFQRFTIQLFLTFYKSATSTLHSAKPESNLL